jgi:catechol 2,3-dioxygenase-like lactoylglutathione lyase family enzyme
MTWGQSDKDRWVTLEEDLEELVAELHVTPEPDVDLILDVGCGDLENLLRDHEVELWPRIEALARADVRFRRALASVWAYESPALKQRAALLAELGETTEITVGFTVAPNDFSDDPPLSWRAYKSDATVPKARLATVLRSIATWLDADGVQARSSQDAALRQQRALGLVPELEVVDLDRSLRFFVDALGFDVAYDRPAERFSFLSRGQAAVMLEEAAGPGRRFRTAPLEPPFGRGVNFQLAVDDVDEVHRRVVDGGHTIVVPLEERWYEVAPGVEAGNRQFVVADPDGYLWRPFTDLGRR